ncbi:uncharacterized protein LOC111136690 [Crassostrea virginica]
MSDSSDEQAAGQHYLVCGTEDCKENGQFYCNDCHRPLCEQCRDEHLKNQETKIHEVVVYRQRKHQLPVEKCKHYPTRNIDMFCKQCHIPLCSKCSTMKEHDGHKFDDLEDIYTEKYEIWQGEFSKIQRYFLPTTQNLKKDIKEDVAFVMKIMENIRTSMKAETETITNLVVEVSMENIEQTHTMEKTLLKMLRSQETTYDEYIAYLGKMTDEFQDYLSLTNQNLLFSQTIKIKTIPETTKPVPPVFTAGQFNKDDITKLLGKVSFPNIKPDIRKLDPVEAVSTHMKFIEKHLEEIKEKSNVKQTLSLSSSVTKIREYRVPGVYRARHVSVDQSDRLWASDWNGNLVQTDQQGNVLQKIQTSGTEGGYHTVTQDESLIYTERSKRVIYRIPSDKTITEFIKTGEWTPLSIHSSQINGDILVGMIKDKEAKVTRYNKTGKEIQNIQMDNQGHELCKYPYYITENINDDICISDDIKSAVVVVNKSGQYRFSYAGQSRLFHPCGICTDILGNILVCDCFSENIHLVNQHGEYLSLIHINHQESMFRSTFLSSVPSFLGKKIPAVFVWMKQTISMCDNGTATQ